MRLFVSIGATLPVPLHPLGEREARRVPAADAERPGDPHVGAAAQFAIGPKRLQPRLRQNRTISTNGPLGGFPCNRAQPIIEAW